MRDLEKAYNAVMDAQVFDESMLDYGVLEKHIENITKLSRTINSSISIYDNFKRRHLFVSPNHKELFGRDKYEDLQIHPEDFEAVMRNGIACVRHFFIGNKNVANHKLIREYRICINGVYRRVTEQIQLLDTDCKGNVWLTLCTMEISPNQSPPFRVDSKLINYKTGDFISPVDTLFDNKPVLSERETAILKLVHEGFMSKEIADRFEISVHTVNTHRQRILEKLGVDTSIEAVKYAAAFGLLDA
jgi:DNA-binding CsgD family transcriptional regulator